MAALALEREELTASLSSADNSMAPEAKERYQELQKQLEEVACIRALHAPFLCCQVACVSCSKNLSFSLFFLGFWGRLCDVCRGRETGDVNEPAYLYGPPVCPHRSTAASGSPTWSGRTRQRRSASPLRPTQRGIWRTTRLGWRMCGPSSQLSSMPYFPPPPPPEKKRKTKNSTPHTTKTPPSVRNLRPCSIALRERGRVSACQSSVSGNGT